MVEKREEWRNGTKSGGLTEGGDEWGEGREFAWNTWHLCRRALDHFSSAWLANVSRLAWKMFTGERRLRANAYAFPPPSLSLSFSISSSVGWFNRETRNEKSAGTKSAKLRPILVVDSILLLFLRKCVDIPTVMSYVKLSPTFSVPLVSPTYLHTCFEGCEYVGEGEGGGTQASIARA